MQIHEFACQLAAELGPHWHLAGYRNPPAYPEHEGLNPGEMWCYNRQSVVPDSAEVQHRLDASQPCLRGPNDDCRGEVTGVPPSAVPACRSTNAPSSVMR